ncbi:MAG: 50S ribosomal protein L22 [Candidatus Micrarchaeota archaeon]
MPNYGYSSYKKTSAKFAKAQAHDIDASFKDLGAVCDAIRRKSTDQALAVLEAVSEGTTPVLYKKHNKHLGHRRELGGKKGRYPKKSAKIVLTLLKNVIANAAYKGMGDDLIVKHACANKHLILPRMAPRGTSRRSNYETAKIEIVVEESPESKKSFEKLKLKAKDALSKADRDKLVSEESKRLTAHLTSVIKKKAQEKKEAKKEEEKEGSHENEEKEQAHDHSHEGHEHLHSHEHKHEGENRSQQHSQREKPLA